MKSISKVLLILLVACIPLNGLQALSEMEKIHEYDVMIKIQQDRSLTIREDIRVYANNEEINRGIYRDIPQIRTLAGGLIHKYVIQVSQVLKNGEPEPYHIQDDYSYKRIYIGKEDVYLDPGMYSYTIIYKVSDALESFSNNTMLYWNAIGDQWKFPILNASLKIILPEGAGSKIESSETWHGIKGSTDSDSQYERSGSQLYYRLNGSLSQGEAWTVKLVWQDSTIPVISGTEKMKKIIRDNLGIFVILAGIVFVMIYYLITWYMLGRDPASGSIMVYYEPPDGLSPASMRFIKNMAWDQKIFSTIIVSMAVKGFILIEEEKDKYTLTRLTEDSSQLSKEEIEVSKRLFEKGSVLEIKNANHQTFKDAIKAAKNSLKSSYINSLFVTNKHIFIPGLLATIVITIFGLALSINNFVLIFMLIWLSFWNVGVFFLLKTVVAAWKKVRDFSSHKLLNTASAMFMTLFSSLFVGADVVVFFLFLNMGTSAIWMVLLFASAVVLNYVFFRLLKAPTRAGRKVMDKIEGFRRYIDVAEKEKIEYFNPPARTLDIFEKLLPYALAFEMEKNWAGYFHDQISSVQSDQTYSPSWYHGTSFSAMSFTEFSSSLGSSLATALASASTSPSSGSSGGSSGGGGGGGGGGGW